LRGPGTEGAANPLFPQTVSGWGSMRTASSSLQSLRFVGTHLISEFGRKPLIKITRFECKGYLDRLGKEVYSSSLMHKAKTYLKAVLEEAVLPQSSVVCASLSPANEWVDSKLATLQNC